MKTFACTYDLRDVPKGSGDDISQCDDILILAVRSPFESDLIVHDDVSADGIHSKSMRKAIREFYLAGGDQILPWTAHITVPLASKCLLKAPEYKFLRLYGRRSDSKQVDDSSGGEQ
nr:hypothetical protein CFP56_67829 [Quercus suber]